MSCAPACAEGSRRAFYKEFVKVVEAADVVIEVLDARDPLSSRCPDVERFVRQAGASKKLILLLNKIGKQPDSAVLIASNERVAYGLLTKYWTQPLYGKSWLKGEQQSLPMSCWICTPSPPSACLSLDSPESCFHKGTGQAAPVIFIYLKIP